MIPSVYSVIIFLPYGAIMFKNRVETIEANGKLRERRFTHVIKIQVAFMPGH